MCEILVISFRENESITYNVTTDDIIFAKLLTKV